MRSPTYKSRTVGMLVPALSMVMLFTMLCCDSQLSAAEQTAESWRVFPPGERPKDARLGKQRSRVDAYHPWTPPTTKDDWEREAQAIRERVLVSAGLWPMPPKIPLDPVIHGKVDRDDYTVERVYFASHPGHYVTGQLYRPKHLEPSQRVPGVLCPHGHWANGRFYDAGEAKAKADLQQGAESYLAGARYPLQARMVQLARMGCIVFHYDMVGMADSKKIGHGMGFRDAEASLRLQNSLGLQTFNSIRALDFLLSIPEVDPKRIAVTGGSGGGTQTFLLCAVDPRPTVAFPAVMVSTGMQGGCFCENADYLRIGINNVAIAATFAPKPMALSAADDWTSEIETKGLPELKHVYSLYHKAPLVQATALLQFKHNYNQVSRELMYNWFNTYLHLGLPAPVAEHEFQPLPLEELRVFDDVHPVPDDALDAAGLRNYLTRVADEQFKSLLPSNEHDLIEYRHIIGTAARVMLDPGPPPARSVKVTQTRLDLQPGLVLYKGTMARSGSGEQIPYVSLVPDRFNGTTVLWLDGAGMSHLFDSKGRPAAPVRKLLDAGCCVSSADLFLTGEYLADAEHAVVPEVDKVFPGFTFCYNRPLVSNRVRDILTVISGLQSIRSAEMLHLVGTGRAGLWALLAKALAGESVGRTVIDLEGFSYQNVSEATDPNFLPGALKYGGVGGLAALSAPGALLVGGTKGIPAGELLPLKRAYRVARGTLRLAGEPLSPETIVAELLR